MEAVSKKISNYNLDMIMFPSEELGQFDEFMTQYGELSEPYVYREIAEVKSKVSKEVLQQHIKNLDALYQMDGFVTDSHRQRIHIVRSILTEDIPSENNLHLSKDVEGQFLYGSSLLLWFLTLLAIWRRPYGWGY